MLVKSIQVVLDRVIDAEIHNIETSAFHHHGNEVLADIVDVAFDGPDHHGPKLRCAGFGKQRAQDDHPAFHGVGGQQNFRHE